MQYRVALKGIELASYTVAVGTVTDVDGRKAIPIQAHAQLAGIAAWFNNKVNDTLTSWIDVTNGHSLRFQVDEYATGKNQIEHSIVEIGKREGDTVPVYFHLDTDQPEPEPQTVSTPEIWDLNSFLIALRSWEAAPGTSQHLEVFRSRYLWKMDVTVHGKTKLETELGKLPALQFDAHVVKLARDGSKYPDTDERDFSLWISDDAGRVPLRIDARTDYGAVTMTIVDYQAGNGDPLSSTVAER